MNISINKTEIKNENLFNLDNFDIVSNYEITDNDHNINYEIDIAKSSQYNNYYRSVIGGYHLEQNATSEAGLLEKLTQTEWDKYEKLTPENVEITTLNTAKRTANNTLKNNFGLKISQAYTATDSNVYNIGEADLVAFTQRLVGFDNKEKLNKSGTITFLKNQSGEMIQKTILEAREIINEIDDYASGLWYNYGLKLSEINAITDIDDLNNIDLSL